MPRGAWDWIAAALVLGLLVLGLLALAAGRFGLPERLAGSVRVIDGDTLALGATRIRLAGMDAPELAQTCGPPGRGLALRGGGPRGAAGAHGRPDGRLRPARPGQMAPDARRLPGRAGRSRGGAGPPWPRRRLRALRGRGGGGARRPARALGRAVRATLRLATPARRCGAPAVRRRRAASATRTRELVPGRGRDVLAALTRGGAAS